MPARSVLVSVITLSLIMWASSIFCLQNIRAAEPPTTKGSMDNGVWELKNYEPVAVPASNNDCYPGRSVKLDDGSAVFSQGYKPCGGAVEQPGTSTSTITWALPQTLRPGSSFKVYFSIATKSDPMPLYGGASAVLYFNGQNAIGAIDHKGRLDDPNLQIPLDNKELEVPLVPGGQIGDKLTMWVNVSGESGSGDVFYYYVMTDGKQSPSGPIAITSNPPSTSQETSPEPVIPPDPRAGMDSGARFSSISREVEWYPLSNPEDRHFATLNDALPIDAVVVTGEDSSATITFSDLSTLQLKPESKVVISVPPEGPSRIELISGKVWMNIKKVIAGESIEVKSNLATIGIKGTTFEVQSFPSYDEISVTEGTVIVTHSLTGEKRTISGGDTLRAVRHGFEVTKDRSAPSTSTGSAVPSIPPGAGSGTVPDFSHPDQVVVKGSWGIFEPQRPEMTLNGRSFSRYFLQHPGNDGPTEIHYSLKGAVTRLVAWVGIDQSMKPEVPLGYGATARVTATGDGRKLWESGVVSRSMDPIEVDLDLQGIQELILTVDDAGDGTAFDWLVWADPHFQ